MNILQIYKDDDGRLRRVVLNGAEIELDRRRDSFKWEQKANSFVADANSDCVIRGWVPVMEEQTLTMVLHNIKLVMMGSDVDVTERHLHLEGHQPLPSPGHPLPPPKKP